MKIKIPKLGIPNMDLFSSVAGSAVFASIRGDGSQTVWFQPRGEGDEKTGELPDCYNLDPARLKDQTMEEVEIPDDVIGTEAEDEVTGFRGTISRIIVHQTGCVHLEIQPAGALPNGALKPAYNFSILRLMGKALPKKTKAEVKKEKKTKPSPFGGNRLGPDA